MSTMLSNIFYCKSKDLFQQKNCGDLSVLCFAKQASPAAPSWAVRDLNCDSSVGRRFIIFFRQRKKEYLSIFLEIAETGFEPATSGL